MLMQVAQLVLSQTLTVTIKKAYEKDSARCVLSGTILFLNKMSLLIALENINRGRKATV